MPSAWLGFGHHVTATDWSPQMVKRTGDRALRELLTDRVHAITVGAHDLQRLEEAGRYYGAYSNLGPLNCVPSTSPTYRANARACSSPAVRSCFNGDRALLPLGNRTLF